MTLQTIFDKVRRITNTSTASLPDTRLLSLSNEAFLYIQRELAQNEIESFGAVAKTDISSGKENYQLPDDLLTILRIEINYDDVNDESKWVKMTATDLGNLPIEWYKLIKSQPKSKPLFDLFSNNIWTFPEPDANRTLGLRLWYIAKQPDFTSASDELHPVLANYWDILAEGTAWLYYEEIGHPSSQRRFDIFHAKLQKMVSDLKIEVIESTKMGYIDYFNSGWI
ncbi:MAG: hypothetical protein N3D20_02785 [Candidatus Pacearchaeota archaeon]|nr:hypothetical protein [Candidatus Calescibacterium sp.]MCX8159189.1 hypothetical protein [Candidatus Pacearchaeota archaeon]